MLLLLLVVVGLLNLSFGSVSIPFKDVIYSLLGKETLNNTWQYIIVDYRLPKTITAILVGSSLALSGLLMQTLFRNPLAGPFVLGISSGASLGVALLLLGAGFFGGTIASLATSDLSMVLAASGGAFLILLVVLIAASKVRNTMSILIIGLMFGSFTSAIISIMAYFSTAEQLQQFMFWSYGSLGNLSWQELGFFFGIYSLGILLIIFIIKPLNSLLLGENYAKSMGVNFKSTRTITLVATSLLTGVCTAFAGPIAFIGLAVPHLTRLVITSSDHKILVPAVALTGAILMLISDTIAQLPTSDYTLPLNAVTTLFGAPIVIWLLVRKRKLIF
ncbi:MAG: iron ABC transporter permease [Flavobacteriaceae bacterium]|nr:iron ABC transporter permease [Flavobacteriaceae bacterium]